MRISDWSSDVCSSDLVAARMAVFSPLEHSVDPFERAQRHPPFLSIITTVSVSPRQNRSENTGTEEAMNAFPKTIHFIGSNTPRRLEISARNLEVEGEIPAEIDGAFFRAVPDNAHPPMFEDDIALNHHGMISRS